MFRISCHWPFCAKRAKRHEEGLLQSAEGLPCGNLLESASNSMCSAWVRWSQVKSQMFHKEEFDQPCCMEKKRRKGLVLSPASFVAILNKYIYILLTNDTGLVGITQNLLDPMSSGFGYFLGDWTYYSCCAKTWVAGKDDLGLRTRTPGTSCRTADKKKTWFFWITVMGLMI